MFYVSLYPYTAALSWLICSQSPPLPPGVDDAVGFIATSDAVFWFPVGALGGWTLFVGVRALSSGLLYCVRSAAIMQSSSWAPAAPEPPGQDQVIIEQTHECTDNFIVMHAVQASCIDDVNAHVVGHTFV